MCLRNILVARLKFHKVSVMMDVTSRLLEFYRAAFWTRHRITFPSPPQAEKLQQHRKFFSTSNWNAFEQLCPEFREPSSSMPFQERSLKPKSVSRRLKHIYSLFYHESAGKVVWEVPLKNIIKHRTCLISSRS